MVTSAEKHDRFKQNLKRVLDRDRAEKPKQREEARRQRDLDAGLAEEGNIPDSDIPEEFRAVSRTA